jgi:flagella basal body P-ring formation protein FlgA
MTSSRQMLLAAGLIAGIALQTSTRIALAELRDLPVPAKSIEAGTVIVPEMIVLRKFRTTHRSMEGVAASARDMIGKESRWRLQEGKPIPLRAVQAATLVRRGSTVLVSFQEGGLAITAKVRALRDGKEGDVIETRNGETGAIIRALVLPDGTLSVAEP